MHRIAVFVDAGYIYAQSAVSLAGSNLNRTQLKLDEWELINQLKALALTVGAGAQLLRIYWYEGAKSGMTVEQLVLAEMSDVKVRLGSINSVGQQKGVDSLIVTDLIDLARNQALSDAAVVTGDGDRRIAVQIAQSFGVRVHLVGLEPSRTSQSLLLRQETDTIHEISRTDIAKFMQFATLKASASIISISSLETLAPAVETLFTDAVKKSIEAVLLPLSSDEMTALKQTIATSQRVPEQYDRPILGTCRGLFKRDLSDDERRAMRHQTIKIIIGFEHPST